MFTDLIERVWNEWCVATWPERIGLMLFLLVTDMLADMLADVLSGLLIGMTR